MKGKCLCGAITISAPDQNAVGACHCDACRRWGGGPLFTIDCGNELSIQGQEHIQHYRSSQWAERGFCTICGTHLYYLYMPKKTYAVSAGLFDDQSGLELSSQLFVDRKPDYYALANRTSVMTHDEVMAIIHSEVERKEAEQEKGNDA